jgi:hypothetical protein
MLGYSYIDTKPLSLPTPRVNGGWYTGIAAKEGGGYGNVSMIPEAHMFMEYLRSANPPPYAVAHVPSDTRPGNNLTTTPYHQELDAKNYNIRCIYRQTTSSQ